MKISRNKLAAHVNLCAAKATIPRDMRADMVAAMLHPRVVRVAVGSFYREDCVCPLTHVNAFGRIRDAALDYGFGSPEHLAVRDPVDKFWALFDAPYRGEQVLEVTG